MAHLIACLGADKDSWNDVNTVIQSGFFDKIYIVTTESCERNYIKPNVLSNTKSAVNIQLVKLNFNKSIEELVPDLYIVLKKYFMQDKVQDLDMAVNISSGTGKEHAIVISTLMKLGYGIRLVDLDKDRNLLEMM
jgi:hypothetical protein